MRTVVIGAGGHARSVIAAATAAGLELVGCTAPDASADDRCEGLPILGSDDVLGALRRQGVQAALVGVGGTGDNRPRAHLATMARELGFALPILVHPTASVAPSAVLGSGSVVLARAVVGPGSRVGADVIVNTGAIVEHDCELGDDVHVASGAVLGGGVHIAAGAHVGLGASVIQGVTVGQRAIVGAGAVVIEDVAAAATVVGSPARTRSKGH